MKISIIIIIFITAPVVTEILLFIITTVYCCLRLLPFILLSSLETTYTSLKKIHCHLESQLQISGYSDCVKLRDLGVTEP